MSNRSIIHKILFAQLLLNRLIPISVRIGGEARVVRCDRATPEIFTLGFQYQYNPGAGSH